MGKKKQVDVAEASLARDIQGFETAVVRFRRKPAKMGADYIFWIPRTYIRNGLVDPTVEYEVYLKRILPAPNAPLPQESVPQSTAPTTDHSDSG